MRRRKIRMDQALDLLPPLAALGPLRSALIAASIDDPDRVWTGSERYRTLETRLLDLAALEAEIPRVLESERSQAEQVWRHTLEAFRAVEAGDTGAAATAFVDAGEVEEDAGRLEAAEILYGRALELGRKPRDRQPEGLALRRLGRIARARGDIDVAIVRYLNGFQIGEAEGDVDGMIVACQGLGNCHVDRGAWGEAERWYRRGMELLGEGHGRERWQLEVNLSIVARRAGALDESAGWIAAAQETAAGLEEGEGQAILANAEGLLLAARKRLNEAEAAYRQAVASTTTPAARATVLVNLAECLLLQGRLTESVEVIRELERLAIAQRLKPFLLHVYLGLAAVARAEADPEGVIFYEQALELARGGGNPVDVALVQREYAGWEAAQGMPDTATERLTQAAAIFGQCGSSHDQKETLRELERLSGEPPLP